MTAHAECSINTYLAGNVSKAFYAYGALNVPGTSLTNQRYEMICEKLRKADARVNILGMATVLSNRSIGWAILSLKDRTTEIGTSDYANARTMVHEQASQDIADERMVFAINEALATWTELDQAIARLDEVRKSIRVRPVQR